MSSGPRFLEDGELPAEVDAAGDTSVGIGLQLEPDATAGAMPRGPMLLDAEPNAPQHLDINWAPEVVATPRLVSGTAIWISCGIGVLLMSWIGLSFVQFVAGLFRSSNSLGILGAAGAAIGLALIGIGAAREWRAYRSLAATERLRALLTGSGSELDTVRTAGLDWARRTAPDAKIDLAALETSLAKAASVLEVRTLLRSRLSDRLRETSLLIGRRAAVQGATLVAICPHPALDAMAVTIQGIIMMRQIATLHGVRPGLAVTISLMRTITVVAAGTGGIAYLSQSAANHLLNTAPGMKHIAAAVPEMGMAASRLYRLAGITATACCPI